MHAAVCCIVYKVRDVRLCSPLHGGWPRRIVKADGESFTFDKLAMRAPLGKEVLKFWDHFNPLKS